MQIPFGSIIYEPESKHGTDGYEVGVCEGVVDIMGACDDETYGMKLGEMEFELE